MSKLSPDFPGFVALDEAGEATKAKVRKRIAAGTLTDVDGIGPETATKIELAFEEIDSPANQAKDLADIDTDAPGTIADLDAKGADARTEAELRDQAQSPALKRTVDESFGEKLAHSRFCFYDDPEGPFVANADTVTKRNERIKVLPISMCVPKKGVEVYDGEDHYALTEDMGVTNFGEPGDWLKIRSPNTGLALIR